jgi:hypothetical protein
MGFPPKTSELRKMADRTSCGSADCGSGFELDTAASPPITSIQGRMLAGGGARRPESQVRTAGVPGRVRFANLARL